MNSKFSRAKWQSFCFCCNAHIVMCGCVCGWWVLGGVGVVVGACVGCVCVGGGVGGGGVGGSTDLEGNPPATDGFSTQRVSNSASAPMSWRHFCIPGSGCSRLSVSNGYVSPGASSYSRGSTVTYHCNSGYRLVGSSTRSCGSNGRWSGSSPSCQSE